MKRTRYDLFAEILESSKEGAGITHIVYSCKLNWILANQLIDELLDAQLVETGDSFHTTEEGMQFIQSYKKMSCLLQKKIATRQS